MELNLAAKMGELALKSEVQEATIAFKYQYLMDRIYHFAKLGLRKYLVTIGNSHIEEKDVNIIIKLLKEDGFEIVIPADVYLNTELMLKYDIEPRTTMMIIW